MDVCIASFAHVVDKRELTTHELGVTDAAIEKDPDAARLVSLCCQRHRAHQEHNRNEEECRDTSARHVAAMRYHTLQS